MTQEGLVEDILLYSGGFGVFSFCFAFAFGGPRRRVLIGTLRLTWKMSAEEGETDEPLLLLDGDSPIVTSPPAATTTTTQPVRKRVSIHSLAAEIIVAILEFLRATDLISISETDKTVFSQTRIKLAVAYQLNSVSPPLSVLLSPVSRLFLS